MKVRHIFDTGVAVILRRCHLGDRACVSNFAQAPTRRRGHCRGRPRRGFGQASETRKKHAEKWRPWRETPKIGEILASRAIECWPLVRPNILVIFTRGGRVRASVEANARKQRKITANGSLRCQGTLTNIRLIPDAITDIHD